jgi:hypothetical protein
MTKQFQLILFSTCPRFIGQATAAGVDVVIVDWERLDKRVRQSRADTQINLDTLEDLIRVRACTDVPVLCRINHYHADTPAEVEQAVSAGVDEILLPMVRAVDEVEMVLGLIRGRCDLGILVETEAAVALADRLARLPLSRAYVGLNDLAIERATPNIFNAVADGTVEQVRRAFSIPFGFAGLTRPDRGHPIPCRLLIGEMARLDCGFSFLRRSFLADVPCQDLAQQVPRIRQAVSTARRRSPGEVARDRAELCTAIAAWRPAFGEQ